VKSDKFARFDFRVLGFRVRQSRIFGQKDY
jgi:hypothetical protein